jgi:hypothetical protein
MSQSEDSQNSQSAPATPQAQAGAAGQLSAATILGALFTLCLLLYAAWTVAPLLPVIGPFIDKATEPANLLEKATVPGRATHEDFKMLVDAGGLEMYDSWQGLKVLNIHTEYSKDNRLNQLTLRTRGTSKWAFANKQWVMESNIAPPVLIRSTLAKVCASDQWKVSITGGTTTRVVDGVLWECAYNKADEKTNDTYITVLLTAQP